jgi:hypothetical protein
VYEVYVMGVSNWPSERAPRLERDKKPRPRTGKKENPKATRDRVSCTTYTVLSLSPFLEYVMPEFKPRKRI